MKRATWLLAGAIFGLLSAGGMARAQDLRVGVRAEFNIDPHFIFNLSNMAIARYTYDSFVDRDTDGYPRNGITESWKLIDDHTWEFRLRPGVHFQDGSTLTAEDIKFSIDRIPNVPENPNPYTPNLRSIIGVEIVDPLTIRLHTDRPNAVLPGQMTNIFIVSHIRAAGATSPDFDSGRAAIGTGPYKMVGYKYGASLDLERDENYHGAKPYYRHIHITVIPNDSARIAALLAGDVDLVDLIPPTNVAALETNPAVSVFKKISDRIFYLQLDQRDHVPSGVTDAAGQPLTTNPFHDARVRQALNMAIDRTALIKRVLDGQGEATGQLIPKTFGAYNPAIPVPAYDPEGARKLIAAAGLKNGLGMTVTCMVGDAALCQVLGQMFARAGVAAKVETTPGATFYSKLARHEIPIVLYSSSTSSTRDASYTLIMALHSVDTKQKLGGANRGGFADAGLDRMIEDAAFTTASDRDQKLEAAMAEGMRIAAVLPLYDEVTISAGRKGLTYEPRVDEQLVATAARPAP